MKNLIISNIFLLQSAFDVFIGGFLSIIMLYILIFSIKAVKKKNSQKDEKNRLGIDLFNRKEKIYFEYDSKKRKVLELYKLGELNESGKNSAFKKLDLELKQELDLIEAEIKAKKIEKIEELKSELGIDSDKLNQINKSSKIQRHFNRY